MNITELERKGLIKALNIKEEDIFEARYNLLGFFSTLYKINKRLSGENDDNGEGEKDD